MKIKIINQKPGINDLSKEINDALLSGRFKAFRALVAYVSWGGIGLIHEKLETFYDQGNNLSLIIGVGDDGSEIDVLRYFKQRFPKADINIFYAPTQNYKFHPKVYMFSGNKESLIFIGSNNLTKGGLFCNSECSTKLEIHHKKDKKIYDSLNVLWKTYSDPKPPFFIGNLHKLSKKLFAVYPKSGAKKQKVKQTTFNKLLESIFPSIKIPAIPKTTLQRQFVRHKKQVRLSKKCRGKVLFLQVLKETGLSGTQVQIPREVIEGYFNVPTTGHQTIEIQIEKGAIRPAVICHFKNNTHRISFPEIAKFRRPLLMKFINEDSKLYKVNSLKGSNYKKGLKKCTKQTRYSAKRWGVS